MELDSPRVSRGGRPQRPWTVVATLPASDESPRVQGQKWLKAQQIIHQTLTSSIRQGRLAFIARCHECIGCTKAWNFSFNDSQEFVVGSAGEHNETNKEALKRH